jgi:hypothetical protein
MVAKRSRCACRILISCHGAYSQPYDVRQTAEADLPSQLPPPTVANFPPLASGRRVVLGKTIVITWQDATALVIPSKDPSGEVLLLGAGS